MRYNWLTCTRLPFWILSPGFVGAVALTGITCRPVKNPPLAPPVVPPVVVGALARGPVNNSTPERTASEGSARQMIRPRETDLFR